MEYPKYKIGDEIEDKTVKIKVIDAFENSCVVENNVGDSLIYSFRELHKKGYELVPKEIPKAGTLIKTHINMHCSKVRVSSGKLDAKGWLLCYVDGNFQGCTTDWDKWEVIK